MVCTIYMKNSYVKKYIIDVAFRNKITLMVLPLTFSWCHQQGTPWTTPDKDTHSWITDIPHSHYYLLILGTFRALTKHHLTHKATRTLTLSSDDLQQQPTHRTLTSLPSAHTKNHPTHCNTISPEPTRSTIRLWTRDPLTKSSNSEQHHQPTHTSGSLLVPTNQPFWHLWRGHNNYTIRLRYQVVFVYCVPTRS